MDSRKSDTQGRYIGEVYQYIQGMTDRGGRQPLAFTHSFGCAQSVADGERINGLLSQMGYGFTDLLEQADIVVYNTCAVRENAEDRVFGSIGELKHHKARNPGLITVLCGCMIQQEHIVEKIKRSYPQIDILFGTNAIHRLPEFLHRKLSTGKRALQSETVDTQVIEGLPILREKGARALIPIMFGCNNFCTYCVVPFVRGRERSRSPEDIAAELQTAVDGGFRDITLIGQNVNSYHFGEMRFVQLLERLNQVEGDFRLRFMTSHPKDCTHELIDTIAQCDKLCKHIHLPVQSGSNRILRLMNRGYTAEDYLELIDYARQRIPGVTFTSDIIVGFPGETRADFEETLRLVEKAKFSAIFTFIYSKRVGTKAAEMDDPVPAQEKSAWFRELLKVQEGIRYAAHEALQGTVHRVLVEDISEAGEGWLMGRTDTNFTVDFQASPERKGSFVQVLVTEVSGRSIRGRMV